MYADPQERSQEDRSLPDLTRELVNHVSDLVRNEARLARAEASEKFETVTGGLVQLVFAAALGAAAVTLALFALAYALAEVMPMWGAALISAAIGGVIALVLFNGSKKSLSAKQLSLPKTMKQVSRDAHLAKETLS